MSELRTGFTTGTCAAAAAKGATALLVDGLQSTRTEIGLPDGERIEVELEYLRGRSNTAEAAIRKFAGDDPDITDGVLVVVAVSRNENGGINFSAGPGVGMVTRPGLSIPPGEPAINPGPRKMISQAVREVTDLGLDVSVSIPGGDELAKKTFNPRLGVLGGLSILGTTGRVHPYSCPALQSALACALDMAVANGVSAPVLVPGHMGERAAMNYLQLSPDQVIQVSNEWGYMLDRAAQHDFKALLALGHPGKLVKLAFGHWDTHSSRSDSAVPFVRRIGQDSFGFTMPMSATTEGLFEALTVDQRTRLAEGLAGEVLKSIFDRIKGRFPVAVVFSNIHGDIIGHGGSLDPWL